MGMSFITLILILMICVCCIVMTQSASNEDDWSHSRNPRANKGPMKRLMNLGKHENVGNSSSREIRKKGRLDEGSSSGRKRLPGFTEVKFEPEYETGDTPITSRKLWTNEEQKGLLRLAYITSAWKGPKTGEAFNWHLIAENWNRDWNDKNAPTLKTKLMKLRNRMRLAAQKFDAEHRWAQWPEELNHNLLKIYFNTEGGDETGHGERILAEWRSERLPGYEQLSAKDLFDRAETILGSVMKFDISDPRGRNTILGNRELVDWKPEQDEYFRQLLLKHPQEERNRMKKICDEAREKFPGLVFIKKRRLYEHLKHIDPDLTDIPEAGSPVVGSFHDTTHSQHHSLMGDYNSTALSLGSNFHHDGMASMSSHPVPHYDNPDLELHLNTLHVDDRSPDTELKLGRFPHKKGYN